MCGRDHVAIAIALIMALSLNAGASHARWVLPVPDGGDVEPSPPSVQGYLVTVATDSITLKRDSRDGKARDTPVVRLTSRTEFFSAYGGAYKPNELRPGQYVWVWYITQDPRKAGSPAQAAVVMLWSTDPNDKPSKEIRWHFHRRK